MRITTEMHKWVQDNYGVQDLLTKFEVEFDFSSVDRAYTALEEIEEAIEDGCPADWFDALYVQVEA